MIDTPQSLAQDQDAETFGQPLTVSSATVRHEQRHGYGMLYSLRTVVRRWLAEYVVTVVDVEEGDLQVADGRLDAVRQMSGEPFSKILAVLAKVGPGTLHQHGQIGGWDVHGWESLVRVIGRDRDRVMIV